EKQIRKEENDGKGKGKGLVSLVTSGSFLSPRASAPALPGGVVFCLREQWDLGLVSSTLPRLDPTHQDARILRDVQACADREGFVLIEYRYGKGLSFGRAFSGGRGYQALSKELRSALSAPFYVEDDIVNAFPTIMSQVFKRAGL